MNLNEITSFLAVVHTGSLSAAAEKLYISQSTLSNRIKNLEAELNTCLFLRSKGIRTISLTEAGKAFIPTAEKWKSLWLETETIMQRSKRSSFRFAAPPSLTSCLLPSLYSDIIANHPLDTFSIFSLSSYECYKQIENLELDMALATDESYTKHVKTTPLLSEKMCLITTPGLAFNAPVHPSQLDPLREILSYWCRSFMQWHEYWFTSTEKPHIFINDVSLLTNFCNVKGCWSIVPYSVAIFLAQLKDISIYDLQDGPEDRIISLLTNSNYNYSYTSHLFIEKLLSYVSLSQFSNQIKKI